MVLEESHVYYAMPQGFQVLGTTNYEVPSEPSPYLRRVCREQMVPSSRSGEFVTTRAMPPDFEVLETTK